MRISVTEYQTATVQPWQGVNVMLFQGYTVARWRGLTPQEQHQDLRKTQNSNLEKTPPPRMSLRERLRVHHEGRFELGGREATPYPVNSQISAWPLLKGAPLWNSKSQKYFYFFISAQY